jgi:hypothetical protein
MLMLEKSRAFEEGRLRERRRGVETLENEIITVTVRRGFEFLEHTKIFIS